MSLIHSTHDALSRTQKIDKLLLKRVFEFFDIDLSDDDRFCF